MIIDWRKFVVRLIPSMVRKSILLAVIDTLIKQIDSNYTILKSKNDKALLYASCTPQVVWLQYLLRQELNYNSIVIAEGDGLPVDFVVYTNLNDVDRLKSLLNRFKMTGRSYLINSENIAYSIRWVDAICEKTAIINTVIQWDNTICAQEVLVTVIHWINPLCALDYGQFRVVDSLGSISPIIGYYSDGTLHPEFTEPFYIEYPGENIAQSLISGNAHIYLGNENPQGRKELTINVDSMIAGGLSVIRFTANEEIYNLTISMDT